VIVIDFDNDNDLDVAACAHYSNDLLAW